MALPMFSTCKLLLVSVFISLAPHSLLGQTDFPYSLRKLDIALLSTGLTCKLVADYRENKQTDFPLQELAELHPGLINSFDRPATEYHNSQLDEISNWGSIGIIAAPSVVLVVQAKDKQWENSLTYGTMYLEVALLTKGITDLTKTLVMRTRPFLYNPNLSLYKREELARGNVYDSFFSGHTAAAFATAVFLSKTYSDIYGNKTMARIIWASSLSFAGTVGYLRFRSGEHYPTDVLAGALVGSCIGYFIPVMHNNSFGSDNLSMVLTGNYVNLAYKF